MRNKEPYDHIDEALTQEYSKSQVNPREVATYIIKDLLSMLMPSIRFTLLNGLILHQM